MADGSVGRKAWLLALGVVLCVLMCAGTASATVYVASADDGSGDGGPDNGDHAADPAIDFRHVTARYDDQGGRVDVSYTFNRAPLPTQQVYAGVSLGTVTPDGSCNAPFFISLGWHLGSPYQQQALVEGVWNGQWGETTGYGIVGELYADRDAPTRWIDRTFQLTDWSGAPAKTWNFSTISTNLYGKTYNCVDAATYVRDTVGNSVDWLDHGPMVLRRASSPPPTSSTAIAWVSPRDGATVSGALTEGGAGPLNCLAAVQGPIDHTINYVDGHAHDTQVNPPWSCEWDTHDVANGLHTLTVVAFDAAGKELARDAITVLVANPDPPATPPAPPSRPTQEPGTGAIGDVCTRLAGACQPVVVITPPAAPPSVVVTNTTTSTNTNTNVQKTKVVLVISKKSANSVADKALLARAGRPFKHRTRYKRACVASNKTGSKWACTASWRQGGKRYTGTVKLSRRNGRTVAKATVHHRHKG